MSVFVLKLIGIISMLFDHTGYIIYKNFSFMNYIGRFAFPIFAFLITEGFIHTRDVKKYFLRLFLFALISQAPYMLFISTFTSIFELNILFTFCLGLLMLILLEKINNRFLKALIVIFTCIIAQTFKFDYGWFGIATIFIFYKFKDNKILMNTLFVLSALILNLIRFINTSYSYNFIFFFLFYLIALLFINLYNGKKGKSIKYFFYIFYPTHLIVLYLISLLLN